ncbi:heterokaryon incompatibility, partial [Colletotrichum cereale]
MPFRSSGEREIYNIWVDTICINQDDPEERAQQVLRMGAIYQHATIIMAWLGYPSEAQDLLLLQMACDLITSLAASLDIGLSSDPKHWNSLRRVFKRSYWNRVWIIQEIAVTKDVL